MSGMWQAPKMLMGTETAAREKALTFFFDEEGKKQVLQEYVERVIILPSKDIYKYDLEIEYRVTYGSMAEAN